MEEKQNQFLKPVSTLLQNALVMIVTNRVLISLIFCHVLRNFLLNLHP